MATTVTFHQEFHAPAQRVWKLLSDQEYVHTKGMRSGSIEVSAEVMERDGETIIISRRRLPAKLPGFARRFVGEVVVLTETQTWGPVQDDGARNAHFVVDFGGQPLAYSGSMTLRPHGGHTIVTTTGTIRASVPFVGGKIEGVARDWSEKYLRKEEQVASELLAGEPT